MKKLIKVIAALAIVLGIIGGGLLLASKDKDDSTLSTTNTSTAAKASGTNQSESQKKYTLSDVAKHGSKSDCWLAINGNVYDVTSFINKHPGGSREILAVCGKDATSAFETQGGRGSHSSRAQSMLADFKIGNL